VTSVAEYFDEDRFASARFAGGNMSATWALRERETGHRYILKQCGQAHDADAEVAISRLGQARGDATPQTRFAADDAPACVISQHVNDAPDEGVLLGDGLTYVANATMARRLVRELDEPLQPLQIVIRDFATDNVDRHGGNVLVMSVDDPTGGREPALGREPAGGRQRLLTVGAAEDAGDRPRKKLVPIDHGWALLGYAGDEPEAHFAGMSATQWLRIRRRQVLFGQFYANLPSQEGPYERRLMLYLTLMALEERRVPPDQVAAEYDRQVESWEDAVDAVDLSGLDTRFVARSQILMLTRLEALRVARDENLYLLTGK
jgi:hypothetical protein